MTQEFLIHNSWIIALALGSGLMLVWPMINKGGGIRVNVSQAIRLVNQRKAVLVDIRDDESLKTTGSLLNAKHIPNAELKDKANALVKNKGTPIIVVCQTGARAGQAAKVLKAAGYPEVFVLEGGANAWKEAGMPLKKAQPNEITDKTLGKSKIKNKVQSD